MSHRPLTRLLQSRIPQCRNFSRTPLFAFPSAPRKPPAAAARPILARKPSPSLSRKVQPTTLPPPPRISPNDAVLASKIVRSPYRGLANRLLGDSPTLCLYKAPSHLGLTVGSCAAAGMLGAYTWNLFKLLHMSTAPWYASTVLVAGCVLLIAFTTGFAMTPSRMLKRVTLLRDGNGNPMLRWEGRRGVDFWRKKGGEVRVEDVYVNKNVPGALTTWKSVPLANGQAWTEDQPLPVSGEREGMVGVFGNMRSAVAKMFWREGMVWVRIGHQNWKMDLVKCEMLENGGPLMEMVQEDHGVREGFLSVVRRYGALFK